ncbi:MAG: hypothetical protein KGL39_22560 [Patescibacteria group bacterium]|nr:hypothetical protein [Patescibacteria group bacterium]
MSAINPNYIGLDFACYYNAGTYAAPNFVLMSNIKDLKRGCSLAEATLGVRDTSDTGPKLELFEPGRETRSIEFDITTDETDTAYTWLRTQKEARAPVELALANGSPIGSAGTVATGGTANLVFLRLTLKVFGFDEDEPDEGGVFTHVTLKPCKLTQTQRPTRVTVA